MRKGIATETVVGNSTTYLCTTELGIALESCNLRVHLFHHLLQLLNTFSVSPNLLLLLAPDYLRVVESLDSLFEELYLLLISAQFEAAFLTCPL